MEDHPTILLIEDELQLRDNLQILLQSAGYQVTTAANGVEGIQQLREQAFDLVITDLVMPGMDGFKVMDYLQVHSSETVVVAITGYVSAESAITALRKGAYDYLAKPLDVDLVYSVVARALELLAADSDLVYVTCWLRFIGPEGEELDGRGYAPLGNRVLSADEENWDGDTTALLSRRALERLTEPYDPRASIHADWHLYRRLRERGDRRGIEGGDRCEWRAGSRRGSAHGRWAQGLPSRSIRSDQ